MGCGLCHTRESLNEVQNHVSHLNALSDQILEHVIPMDDLKWNVLGDLSGRSCGLLCQMSLGRCEVHEIPMDDQSLNELDDLSGRSCGLLCQTNLCRCEVRETPMDDQSLNELDDLSGRSSGLLCQMSFYLSKVCQRMVCQFLARVIPMDGQSVMLACDLNRVILNCGRYKKVCLTSSFFPGGRR